MIGKWCRFGDGARPQEGEGLVFLRPGTAQAVSMPVVPFEHLLGEKAEVVPAVYKDGQLIEQNGHSQAVDDDIWWVSLPAPPVP